VYILHHLASTSKKNNKQGIHNKHNQSRKRWWS
jgi:hypothetical protein